MLQTLFSIPAQIAGIPLFGVGLLLAVWAVASVAILAWLAWRQGFNADTWGYVPVLLLVGAIVRWLLPALCENGGLPIRGYGVMMFLAVVTGTTLAAWRGRRLGIDPDTIFSLAFWMLLPGIVGARASMSSSIGSLPIGPPTRLLAAAGPADRRSVQCEQRRAGGLWRFCRRRDRRVGVHASTACTCWLCAT